MKLLITGAESFVGNALRKECASAGIEVVGIDTVVKPGSEGTVIKADIRDPNLANLLPDGIDTIVHLAAIARDGDCKKDPVLCFDVNVTGTANIQHTARAKGIKQIIYASSEWVYDVFDPDIAKLESEPINPLALTSEYALSKLAGEALLRQGHLRGDCDVTVLRFGIIYGPRHDNWSAVESLLAKVAAGETVEVGSKRTSRGFLHVADIARAVIAAAGHTGFATYNIQPERPVTLGEVVAESARILGLDGRLVETAPDTPSIRNVSGALAAKDLGWRPQTGLAEGLADVATFLGYTLVRQEAAS